MRAHKISRLLFPLVAFILLGCELIEPNFIDQPIDPICEGEDAQVAGAWKISGTGERFDCDDDTFDASFFELRSLSLPITQDEARLELDTTNTPTSFLFMDGRVSGRCVEFLTSEGTEAGTVVYTWSGVVSEDGTEISGQFTGTGPGACETRGNFAIPLRSS